MAGGLWTSMYLSKGPKWPAEQSKPEAGHNRVRPPVILGPHFAFFKEGFHPISAYNKIRRFCTGPCLLVGGDGFEPSKLKATDLQSAPFGHSGTLP